MHLKRTQRVLFKRCEEDNVGHFVLRKGAQDLKAVHTRHLNIQENKVWGKPQNVPEPFHSIARLTNYLNIGMPL